MLKRIMLGFMVCIAFAKANAQDWPNIKRYEDANRKLQPPGATEKRVVYMGDSITDFWINTDSAFFADKPYIDRGISGQTTGQMLLRFHNDVIGLKPEVVVILAGINDIAGNNGPEKLEDIFNNIVSMAQLASVNHIKVVLSSVLPAFALSWRPNIDPVPPIRTLNEWIKNYAAQNNITYLDYFTAMADSRNGLPANLSKDGVHPNLAGYKVMEPLAEKAIDEAIKNNR